MRKIEDYRKVFDMIVDDTYNYLWMHDIHTVVLGLSGGLDSTVVAAIMFEIKNRFKDEFPINFIGVSLPSNTNKQDENDGASLCRCFCDIYKEQSIQEDFEQLRKTASIFNEQTSLADGNIKARIRMIHLYNIAGINKGLVLDTDNLTENNLGFFTIHGDVADLNPIGCLWKSEVYKLAEWIMDNKDWGAMHYDALKRAINITPTDGNGVTSGGDMEQIAPGCTYSQVDEILYNYLNRCYDIEMFLKYCRYCLPEEVSDENVRRIIERYEKTKYKRRAMPFKITIPLPH